MDKLQQLAFAIETHDVTAIDHAFANGQHPNDSFENDSWFGLLISMYTRSSRFADCVRVCIRHGLHWETPALLAVLSNDAHWLQRQFAEHPKLAHQQYYLRSAYTGMQGVSLMHICAEYNHVSCAEVLHANGLDIDVVADKDANGFGGQTPLFHTVNQNSHASADMMHWLLQKGANPLHFVKGIIWGQGFPWETLIPSVDAISYALMGRLPQMHRDENQTAENLSILMTHAYGKKISIPNIPNQYLQT